MSEELLRASSGTETIEHLDGTFTEYSYFEPTPDAMDRLTKMLFAKHWRDVVVGPCIQGSVFEVRFTEARIAETTKLVVAAANDLSAALGQSRHNRSA